MDRTLSPNPNPNFFNPDSWLSRSIFFQAFRVMLMLLLFHEYAIRLHPCVQVSELFSRKILHQFLGVLVTAKSSGFGLTITFIFVVFSVFCRIGLRFSSPCSLALAKSDPVSAENSGVLSLD
jgi:hypothetical protein